MSKRVTISTLDAMKASGDKFVMITAYDATFARLASQAGAETILVGDYDSSDAYFYIYSRRYPRGVHFPIHVRLHSQVEFVEKVGSWQPRYCTFESPHQPETGY